MLNKIKLLLVIILLMSFNRVYASNNILELNDNNNGVYYNSNIFDKNTFIVNTNMLPKEVYYDYLDIVNNSSKKHKIYFNMRMYDQDDVLIDLLNNINIKIYNGDNLIYEGTCKVDNYSNRELNDLIYIGEYDKGDKSTIKVETSLSDNYIVKNTDIAKMDIIFYTNDDDNIVEIPNTGISNRYIVILVVFIIAIISYVIYKKVLVN